MKHVILVSHGEFADGLKNALTMLAGNREDLRSCGLKDGTGTDQFAETFSKAIEDISADDEILLLGDLIGGSPLTTACNVLAEKNLIANTRVVGGMNLPLALSALLLKDAMDLDSVKDTILGEGKTALQEFVIAQESEEDEI